MPNQRQDAWLAANLGVKRPALPSSASVQGAVESGGPPPALVKIPVPQVSGESKEALVKAMATIDAIQPSDKARGLCTIMIDGAAKEITQAQADEVRGKVKAALKQNIGAVKNKAEAAKELYDYQHKLDEDQKVVSTAVKLVRKLTTLGRFEDPGPNLTKEVDAALVGVASALAAAEAGTFAKAAAAFADAEAAAAKASAMAHAYNQGMIDGAGSAITALEGTQTVCFVTVAILATVATAGAASGAIGATTTAFGVEVGTAAAANAVATAAPIAATVAGVGAKVAMGKQVDWGEAVIDIALQLILSRLGGPVSKSISTAVTKQLAGKLAAESLARISIEKVVQGVVLQEGSTVLRTVVESTYAKLRGKPVTWEQFLKTVLARLTDPKDIAVAAVVTAITAGAEIKYGGTPAAGMKVPEGGGEPAGKAPAPKLAAEEPAAPQQGAAAKPELGAASEEAPKSPDDAAPPSTGQPPAAPSKPQPPRFKDSKRHALTDFDKETANKGGITSIEKRADKEGLYGIAIEGELKDPIPREDAPNYNKSDKIIDPAGPGLDPAEWEKAHLVGPGFGDEAAAGLMNAPKEMNQFYQNRGVEGWMRDLHVAVKGLGGKVTYKAKAVAWDFPTADGWKPSSGAEFLKIAEYDVTVEIPGRPRQSLRISIETAPPPKTKVSVEISPEGAANPADLLGG